MGTYSLLLTSVAVIATTGQVLAWDAAQHGGHQRYFVNGEIDLNLRAAPNGQTQKVAEMPRGSHVAADRCINPTTIAQQYGLQSTDDWCHVSWGGLSGWANAAFLQEQFGYAGPMPHAQPPTYQAPPPDQYPPELQQQQQQQSREELPGCGDAEIVKVAVKTFMNNSGTINGTLAEMLIPDNSHALGIDRNSGAKFCVTYFRANEQVARDAESGQYGQHPLSQLAYTINQQYQAGNPWSLKYKIGESGETGRWLVWIVN